MTKQLETARTFSDFFRALDWARTYARESCHPFHFWRIENDSNQFVVAIRSKNTGQLQGYAI